MRSNGLPSRSSGIALCALLVHAAAGASQLDVSVADAAGKPVKDAVVYLDPVSGSVPPAAPGVVAVMDQHDREFVPHVLAVQAGTDISFPNYDNIHHDVYSFSPAKPFELPLYKGTPTKPLSFGKPGIVVLGCNVHDWMLGYIAVVPTPWFAVSDADGKLSLQAPAGAYRLVLWQPDMVAPDHSLSDSVVLGDAPLHREFSVQIKPPPPRAQHPVTSIEDKFKRFQDAKTPPLPN